MDILSFHDSQTVDTDCDGSEVSSRASTITVLTSLMITIPGLLVIGFYGSFANRYGLKRTLIVPVLGNFIYSGCIFLSMQQFMAPYYVPVLLFGSICSGLSGKERVDLFSLSFSLSLFISHSVSASVSLIYLFISTFICSFIPHFVSFFLTDYFGYIIFLTFYIRIEKYFHYGFFHICR